MWATRTFDIPSGTRFELLQQDSRLSFRELFRLLANEPDFRTWYSRVLADCAFEAFYWEHPPLKTANLDDAVEFVLLDAPALAGVQPDAQPFASRFAGQPDADVLAFPNLGGDAVLIAPRPLGPPAAYPHLAAFLRHAPHAQVHDLWRVAARAIQGELGTTPRWLSTSGLGVAWLHLRIDTRPKYYQHTAYKLAA